MENINSMEDLLFLLENNKRVDCFIKTPEKTKRLVFRAWYIDDSNIKFLPYVDEMDDSVVINKKELLDTKNFPLVKMILSGKLFAS